MSGVRGHFVCGWGAWDLVCFVFVVFHLFTSAEGGRDLTFRVFVPLGIRFSCGSLSLLAVALGASSCCMRFARFSVCVVVLAVRFAWWSDGVGVGRWFNVY